MKKTFIIASCLFFFGANAFAQERPAAFLPALPPFIPQKLTIATAKPDLQLGQPSALSTDSARSVLYLGKPANQPLQLDLPALKERKVDFRFRATKRNPVSPTGFID